MDSGHHRRQIIWGDLERRRQGEHSHIHVVPLAGPQIQISVLSVAVMFKFDFNIEEADDVEEILNLGPEPVSPVDQPKLQNAPTKFEPFSEISLSHLVRLKISSTPLHWS